MPYEAPKSLEKIFEKNKELIIGWEYPIRRTEGNVEIFQLRTIHKPDKKLTKAFHDDLRKYGCTIEHLKIGKTSETHIFNGGTKNSRSTRDLKALFEKAQELKKKS